MPNQRKPGKRMLGAWVPQAMFDQATELARANGVPRSLLAEWLLLDGLRRRCSKSATSKLEAALQRYAKKR